LSVIGWPTELKVTDGGRGLRISFDDGQVLEAAASELRRLSPSAEGRGHGPDAPPRTDDYSAARIVSMSPVGRYAVRIGFADGHDSGLFTWPLLRQLAQSA
jgi:DUF971 family protein